MDTFQSVIIHAKLNNEIICKRDILLSPSITLYQLYKIILSSFSINEKHVVHHNFSLPTLIAHNVTIETSFELINPNEIFLDGFTTPVVPGVYIEHSHPHEPLPLFSLYNWPATDDMNMSFRILRDERYVHLDTIIDNHQSLYFEFQYLQSKYSIDLEFQKLKLPTKFHKDIHASPKIINKQGQLFDHQQNHYTIPMPSQHYNKNQELVIAHLCKEWIEKLNQERKLFVLNMHNNENHICHWTESTGDHCVYCHLY